MDRATGELVERSTAYAYGAAESNYRPGDWYEFREDYRFTGKEDDIEVGLIYFGARYLNPQLGRWISADPLAVHAPGKADLNLYAYVHGRVLSAADPVGLAEPCTKVQYEAVQTAYNQQKTELQVQAQQALNTCRQAQQESAAYLARGLVPDKNGRTPSPTAATDALGVYQEITRKIERLDKEWEKYDTAYQAYHSPVVVAVPGGTRSDRAVAEIREAQLAEFNNASNAIKSLLAAPLSILAYTVIQEGRNGKLDAQDHQRMKQMGIVVPGLGALLGMVVTRGRGGNRAFSPEQQALVDMAQGDKVAGGITAADMEAYKQLNAGAGAQGFTAPGAVRGPEVHPPRTPQSLPDPGQQPHGHVGPVGHIPIKPNP